jgi:AcrR family transcriptional regulator
MGVKERKAREFKRREDDILKMAFTLLSIQEPAQVTMEQIAEKAEIGRGTIYKHFKSKDELYARLIVRRREKLIRKLEQIDSEGIERIPRLLRSYMEYCLQDKQEYAVHKRCDNHCIRENLGPKLVNELQKQQKRKIDLIKKILVKALGKEVTESEDLIYYICSVWGMQRGAIDAFLENRYEGVELEEKKYFKVVEETFYSGLPIMLRQIA